MPVLGCTSAGQITEDGYTSDALLAAGLSRKPVSLCLDADRRAVPGRVIRHRDGGGRARGGVCPYPGWTRLALLFTDGLSKQEDLLVSTLETVLPDIPVFGGSAGDGLDFGETFVLQGGRFHTDAALLLLIETSLDVQGFSFDHFQPTAQQLIITGADPEERLVFEINGAPAAREYARLVGCARDALSPQVFAENPILVQHEGSYFVRAVSDATENDALSFMAAIDDGVIMTLGRGKEMIETLRAGLRRETPRRAARFHPRFRLRAAAAGGRAETAWPRRVGHLSRGAGAGLQHLWRAASRRAHEPDLRGCRLLRPRLRSGA